MLVFLIHIHYCLFVMRSFFTTVLMVLLLNACGLKGPLYLPQPAAPESGQAPADGKKK
ncbi:LPS translocon maturation chaperone LptM [Nitrosovibrio tenuis]|uniref:LPS translocon maturation chaperone LptM n=1 Tax=Nitrosovibrio tenuis TaxID=1233 RepID=UPI000B89B0B1